MNDAFPPATPVPTPLAVPGRNPWYSWRRLGFNFLTISILVHLVFAVGAAYLIVQVIQPKRKSFAGAPAGADPKRAVEHKVMLAKQKASMRAPAAVPRVVTTGASKVVLPAMPTMKVDVPVEPVTMAGMSGTGAALGGFGGGGGGGGGGGRGNPLAIFGVRDGKGLKGTLYDLKQTSAKAPTSVNDVESFVHELNQFLLGGWNEAYLGKYFKAPASLYANQFFIPQISSAEAPKAFGVEGTVRPSLWMALYRGQVSPPESGTYHFVGGGDNILIVRLKGTVVLDRSWNYQSKFGIDRNWKAVADYDYGFGAVPGGFAKGQGVELKAGEFYDMQVLLGDDGGSAHFSLLIEKEGVSYEKNGQGLPTLPLFRTSADGPPPGRHPPFQADGPIWKTRSALVPTL